MLKSLKLKKGRIRLSDLGRLDAHCKQMMSPQVPEGGSELPLRSSEESESRDAAGTNSRCVVIQVQEAVHGVTIEECRAALQNHNWNVQRAVHYLKVSASHTAASHWKPNASKHQEPRPFQPIRGWRFLLLTSFLYVYASSD